MTLPAYQTACGCCDIIMHTLERYFVQGPSMELTDALAEGLLRTVMAQSPHPAGSPLMIMMHGLKSCGRAVFLIMT